MKLTKIIGVFALMALFAVSMTSCSGYSGKAAEKMVDRYDSGDMTKDDFSKCIDWVDAYYQDLEKEVEGIINEAKNEKKFEKLAEEAQEKFEKKWEDIDDIIDLLNNATYDDDKDMGKANMKRWEKLKDKHFDKIGKLNEKAEKKFND